MMNDAVNKLESLKEWSEKNFSVFSELGVVLAEVRHWRGNSCSVDLDGTGLSGRITHWSPTTFELQINKSNDAAVLFLETKEIETQENIVAFVVEALRHVRKQLNHR